VERTAERKTSCVGVDANGKVRNLASAPPPVIYKIERSNAPKNSAHSDN
jgi:hypothetical protein